MPKVLLVEDEEGLRDTIAELLAIAGLEVVPCADGAEALEILRLGEKPHLVVLDLKLPRLDGWRFLEIARAPPLELRVPVVVISGAPYDARLFSVAAYLRKPFDGGELLAIVRRLFPTVRG